MIDAPSLSPSMEPMMLIALTCLIAIGLLTFAFLRAWNDWIELKRRELESGSHAGLPAGTGHDYRRDAEDNPHLSVGAARIELADLKERIRKLEAIASGVEL